MVSSNAARVHANRRKRLRNEQLDRIAVDICTLVTFEIEKFPESRKYYGGLKDSDRLDMADRIIKELQKYYGREPEQKYTYLGYNPECYACCKRFGIPVRFKTVETGIWACIKRKFGC
jgi:hypothetical protein